MPKGKKTDDRSTQEKTLDTRLENLREKIKGQKDGATEAQKKERGEIAAALRPIKFVRIANKRIPRTLAAIKGVGALGSYSPTPAQENAIGKALSDALGDALAKLGGKKEAATGFNLPTT